MRSCFSAPAYCREFELNSGERETQHFLLVRFPRFRFLFRWRQRLSFAVFGDRGTRTVRQLDSALQESRALSPDEETKLIENAAPFMQDLILFGLNTGSRVGEIFSLRWSNVDLAKNV
jgi:integrase